MISVRSEWFNHGKKQQEGSPAGCALDIVIRGEIEGVLVGVEPVAGDAGGGGQRDFASEGSFHATLYYLLKF